MGTKGESTPVKQDDALYRSKDIVQLFDAKVINTTNPYVSDGVPCHAFRHFTLYLAIDSTSTPTTLHIDPEFLDPSTGKWYSYKQGLFASLYYEDGDTASGIYEVFTGECVGRDMRLKLTGVGTDSSNYFTVSAAVEFFN